MALPDERKPCWHPRYEIPDVRKEKFIIQNRQRARRLIKEILYLYRCVIRICQHNCAFASMAWPLGASLDRRFAVGSGNLCAEIMRVSKNLDEIQN